MYQKIFLLIASASLVACGGGGGSSKSNSEAPPSPLIVNLVNQVKNVSNDNTPEFVVNSSHAGVLDSSGDCGVQSVDLIVGDNSVELSVLPDGSYKTCEVVFTANDGRKSSAILLPEFFIDTTAAILSEVVGVTPATNNNTPSYTFSTNEFVQLTFEGGCSSLASFANTGNKQIVFSSLPDGIYDSCKIVASDKADNISKLNVSSFVVDTVKPELSEFTAIPSNTNNKTPVYVVSSNEPGSISFTNGCGSAQSSVIAGNNSITLNTLGDGTYNCSLSVTDLAGNTSDVLDMSSFTIDTQKPLVSEVTPVSAAKTLTPEYTFNTNESGNFEVSGSCQAENSVAQNGDNTITLSVENYAVNYNDCLLKVTDAAGNVSDALSISSFSVSPSSVPFYTWVSANDTKVYLPNSLAGFEFYRSRDEVCDFANYASCALGQYDVIADTVITDTALTLSEDAYYTLKSSSNEYSLPQLPSNKKRVATIVFKDKFWSLAGNGKVFSSADGNNWVMHTMKAFDKSGNPTTYSFQNSAFGSASIIEFNGKLWSIGSNGFDVTVAYYSDDGITWQEYSASSLSPGRSEATIVKLGSSLVLFGGYTKVVGGLEEVLKDVWVSSNGSSWTKVANNLPFSTESNVPPKIFSTDSKLYYISSGGDLWTASSASNWQNQGFVGVGASLGRDWWHYFNGTLYKFGTHNSFTGFWKSSDGKTWQQAKAYNTDMPESFSGKVHTLNNQLHYWYGVKHWVSQDGEEWKNRSDYFGEYDSPLMEYFDSRYWNFSSDRGEGVWFSDDAITWQMVQTLDPPESTTIRANAVFNNELWFISDYKLIRSGDGENWTEVNLGYPLSSLVIYKKPQLVNFADKLWMLGGKVSDSAQADFNDDIYSSLDGVTWVKESDTSNIPVRSQAQIFVFNNKLWLYGGFDEMDTIKADLWSSADGINWQLEVDVAQKMNSTPYVLRRLQIMPAGSELYAFEHTEANTNSVTESTSSPVWVSTNGVDWSNTMDVNRAFFSPLYDGSALYLFGGETYDHTVQNTIKHRSTLKLDGLEFREGRKALAQFQ